MAGVLDSDIIKKEATAVIINKLNSLGDQMDKNEIQHRKLFDEIAAMKVAAMGDHPNCKTGIVNTEQVKNLADRIKSRERWGLSIAIVLIGAVATALLAALQ